MKSFVISINKTLRKWTHHLEEILGVRLEPHLIVLVAFFIIISIQITMFLVLSSQTIWCQLPNLRLLNQNRALPNYEKLPTIYAVTPTYTRLVQKAELTRLSHTFMLVPNLHWIIVEDSDWRTEMVSQFVRRLRNEFDFVTMTHLSTPTPPEFKMKPGEPSWKKPRGVWQRNRALEWIRDNFFQLDMNGVVYFADDDNTYDLELFNEMRYTIKVSAWPVGFVGGLISEGPIVGPDDTIQSFNSKWASKRPFPIDMAGFAVNLQYMISKTNVTFSAEQPIGYIESNFLNQLIKSWTELEPKAEKCTKVLVWHTQTKNPSLFSEEKLVNRRAKGLP